MLELLAHFSIFVDFRSPVVWGNSFYGYHMSKRSLPKCGPVENSIKFYLFPIRILLVFTDHCGGDGSGQRDATIHDMETCLWPKQHAISSTWWHAHAMRLPRRDVQHRDSIATTSCSMSRAPACATTEKLLLVTHNVKLPDFRTSPTQPGKQDDIAVKVLGMLSPSMLNDHIHLSVLGDGNCMYRALSRGLFDACTALGFNADPTNKIIHLIICFRTGGSYVSDCLAVFLGVSPALTVMFLIITLCFFFLCIGQSSLFRSLPCPYSYVLNYNVVFFLSLYWAKIKADLLIDWLIEQII